MKLEIITRCTRTDNLLAIKESIFKQPTYWRITWRIIFDTHVLDSISAELLQELKASHDVHFHFLRGRKGDMGHSLINDVLDEISYAEHLMKDEIPWIYVLDDDTILHENFLKETYRLVQENSIGHGAIIFSQKIAGKDFTGLDIRVASPENTCVQKIDMGQFLLHRRFIGDKKFQPDTYTADGIFIEELYKEKPEEFIFYDEVLCYYNYLQKKLSKPYSLPRVLVVGTQLEEIISTKHTKYESGEIYLINPENTQIIKSIYEHDPDCFVSVGEDFKNFPELCNLSYDFRQRWIHVENPENIGDLGYNCSMHSILNPVNSDLVSIFTSAYNTGIKLRRTYESIKNQYHKNWEWVIVNDSTDSETIKVAESLAKQDPRIKVYEFRDKTRGIIGESKYRACVLCRGEFLLELDHDDYLTPDALSLLLSAFKKYPEAGFVYSDCAEIDENYNSLTYGEGFALGYGKYREETHFNRNFKVAIAPNINPLTIRHIVGVPNHFRAWKKESYFKAGCHNRRLSIADDYELIVRTFLTSHIVKIQRGCYLQFFHGSNSQDATRADIQRRVRTISNNYNEKIRNRFEELGKIDWAYNKERPSILTPPKFGEEEGYVNLIMEI